MKNYIYCFLLLLPLIAKAQNTSFYLTTVSNPTPTTSKAITVRGGSITFSGSGMLSTRGCPAVPPPYTNCYFKITSYKASLLPLVQTYLDTPGNYGIMYYLASNGLLNPASANYQTHINSVTYKNKLASDPEEQAGIPLNYTFPEGIVLFEVFGGCNNNGSSTTNSSQASMSISYPAPQNYYRDMDGDGFGNPNVTKLQYNVPPVGYVTNNLDCDDSSYAININKIWYRDSDGDGFGATSPTLSQCSQPSGYVANNSDLNDTVVCITNITPQLLYQDSDADGYGNPNVTYGPCSYAPYFPNDKYVFDNTDCDDKDRAINPGIRWHYDANGDGEITGTELNSSTLACYSPGSSYIMAGNYHWVQTETFNPKGSKTGTIKTFFNDLGYEELFLRQDLVTRKIWGVETKYDNYGRKSRITYPANSSFTSLDKIHFLAANSQELSLLSPNLYKYYSDNNTLEPYQATATQPYLEINYDKLNPGRVLNETGGNKINNEFITGYSYTVPAAQELYYACGYDYFNGPVSGALEEVITKFYKTVSVDANGVEIVTFTDAEGKVLATARSGGTTYYPVYSLIGEQGYVDVHIPTGVTYGQISLLGGSSLYDVYDLKTGEILTGFLWGGKAVRIVAKNPANIPPAKVYVANDATGAISCSNGALGISYPVNYYDYTLNIYDGSGNLIKVVQPNGYEVSSIVKAVPSHMQPNAINYINAYTHNSLGQILDARNPDTGITKYIYRKDGKIRYSQNASQNNNKVAFSDFDEEGRPIESGIIANTWQNAALSPDGPLISGARTEIYCTVYDFAENNLCSLPLPSNLSLSSVLTSANISPSNYLQKNTAGNVAITYSSFSGGQITAATWYSYDAYGRIEWLVQYNDGIGAKTINYQYDINGNIAQTIYQKHVPAEIFYHRYTYNTNNALTRVQISRSTGTPVYTTVAQYLYYQTGELKRVVLDNNIQGIDYVYTLSGKLKSINHPSLEQSKDPGNDATDLFGLTLDYYQGDYLRTGSEITTSATIVPDYVGNIKAARFSNRPLDYTSSTAAQKAYMYSFNSHNQLTSAKFGTTDNNADINTGSPAKLGRYYEGNLNYDSNGNLLTLKRTDNTTTGADATLTDNFSYAYTSGKNRLGNISDTGAATPGNNSDIEGSNTYGYNTIGQMAVNYAENLYYFYTASGQVSEIRKGSTNPLVKFYYNERGHRMRKEVYSSIAPYNLLGTTYYIVDLAGNTLSNYFRQAGNTVVQTELPMYGIARLGSYIKGSGGLDSRNYEIADHLGNVRAVLSQPTNNSTPTIAAYADYYPYGERLPGRNTASPNINYGYQGKETDNETDLEGFQLRLWDGRIGRWTSPDPYRQYHSPYLGMGNNPISRVDKDGGLDDWYIDEFGNYVYDESINSQADLTAAGISGTYVGDTYYDSFSSWTRGDQYGNVFNIATNEFMYTMLAPVVVMNKVYFDVYRDTETDKSTTSTFTFGNVSGYILERPGPDTTTPNLRLRIPAGEYNVVIHNGDNFQNVLKLYNDDVPITRAILIHNGNYPSNTDGCLLCGSTRSTDFVGNSVPTLEAIRAEVDRVGVDRIVVRIHDNIHN